MHRTDDQQRSAIELALAQLQSERETCVKRLEEALQARHPASEIESYFQRLDGINGELMRLAGAHVLAAGATLPSQSGSPSTAP